MKSFSCPTLFITLNPTDIYHKLLHILASGDLEEFPELPQWQRSKCVMDNPEAATVFFDLIIKAFVRIIL